MAATNAAKAAAAKKDIVSDAVEIADDVKDILEESVELVKISWIKANPKALYLGVALAAASLTSVATYMVASKILKKKYQALADEQILSVKETYARAAQNGTLKGDVAKLAEAYETAEPDIAVVSGDIVDVALENSDLKAKGIRYDKVKLNSAAVTEAVKDVSPIVPTPEVTEVVETIEESITDTVINNNIFASDHPDTYWDWDEEKEYRAAHPEGPYLITRPEFDANETDADQYHWTYFDGDGVLVDQNSQMIGHDAVDDLVGNVSLLRFGAASGDKNIVFVRNVKTSMDLEITQSEGTYSREVLGIRDDELTHSDVRQRRFRARDDEHR